MKKLNYIIFIILVFLLISCKEKEVIKLVNIQINRSYLYVGVPNNVIIEGYNGNQNSLLLKVCNQEIKQINGTFTFKIKEEGKCDIQIIDIATGEVHFTKQLLCKEIPLPTAKLYPGLIGFEKEIAKGKLLTMTKLTSDIVNWEMNISFPVQSFNILGNIGGEEILLSSDKEFLSSEQKEYIKNIKPGKHLIIKDIMVKAIQNDNINELAPIIYKVL